jgi:signal transduction histidine kinase
MDIPVVTAATLVLSPVEAGLIAFLSAFDLKEFQGKISPSQGAFNRCQAGLLYASGSALVHAVSAATNSPSLILPLAFLSLTSTYLLNCIFVGAAIAIEYRYPFLDVIRKLRVGAWVDFAVASAAWGVLGAMLAALYGEAHSWALLAFLAPTLLGRQALARSQMFIDSRRAYRSREAALAELSRQIFAERSDERRMIAADLHDEVLQPLFKVTLMAQVLKTDLGSGRLLEMDQDLPELLTAAELASSTLRALIGDLRKSPLGRGGLEHSLRGLAKTMTDRTGMKILIHIAHARIDPIRELVIYQIAKEALSNAVQHSRASRVSLELDRDNQDLRLVISDDGCGFDPSTEKSGHYGVQIMRERASSINAHLFIDSEPRRGSVITLIIPLGLPAG